MKSDKKNKKNQQGKSPSKRGKSAKTAFLPALRGLILNLFQQKPGEALSLAAIAKALGLRDHKSKKALEEALVAMEIQGAVVVEKGHRFRSAIQSETVVGIVDHVNPNFAYIVVEGRDGDDIRVNTPNLLHALDGDLVEVALWPARRGERPEGEVKRIVKRARTAFAGKIQIAERFAFVVCTHRKIYVDFFIPTEHTNKAKDGDKVVVEMLNWPDKEKNPTGKVVRVLGPAGENNTEMHSIMFEFGLPFQFPPEVEAEAERIPDKVLAKDMKKRLDFRKVTTFTIDPLTAKDFDDALSLQRTEEGLWEVGIHIADVTHYVKPGTLLDKEALERATSVYLVDRTIPMLPEKLSNNLCSLRPHEDRLAFSAVFLLDDEARIKGEWFGRTVIHSDRRFTYEEAQERLETGEGEFAEELAILNRLAKKLKDERFRKGAISFESVEFYFELDPEGKPIGLFPKVRKDAHKLIEEFMLLANRKVATFIYQKRREQPLTMVYRTHDSPDPERLALFANFARRFGYKLNFQPGAIPSAFNKLAAEVENTPTQNIIESQAIRTMAKAKYTTEPLGHFGLAFDHYTHFTSPIRRYPDVLVHRLLQHYLDAGESVDKQQYESMCKHSSEREKRAADAERASIKYKQVEFMQQYVNRVMKGVISGVTEWGIYVELEETRCEGMVRLATLADDFYVYDADAMQIVGRKYKRTYSFGDPVTVMVKGTDLEKRQIDFEMR